MRHRQSKQLLKRRARKSRARGTHLEQLESRIVLDATSLLDPLSAEFVSTDRGAYSAVPSHNLPKGGESLLPDVSPVDDLVLGGAAADTATVSIHSLGNQSLPFSQFVRLEIPTAPAHPWHISLSLDPVGELTQGDVLYVGFYARGEHLDTTDPFEAKAYIQENGSNKKLLTLPVAGSTEWKRFSTKVEVEKDVQAGGYKFVLHAGFAPQRLDVGGLVIENYGRLGHRLSDYTIAVQDIHGAPLPEATLDVEMTNHGFKFGTQVRDHLFAVSEAAFSTMNDSQKMALTPNLESSFGIPRFVPTWTDVVNHRTIVREHFNHVVPTTGLQWIALENNGSSIPEAAILEATEGEQTVTAASVVWQKDRWPTPEAFRSSSNPDAQAFHDALVTARLGPVSVLQQFSDAGSGPAIYDWKLLNEPLHEDYYQQVFVEAGIYSSEVDALADYFKRADAIRPDVTLSINEYNVINSANDNFAIQYRNLVQSLLDAGAPIDRIGIQAHISRNDISKEDIVRRLDILAETGLPIEISEFDTRDDADVPQLNEVEQERMFRDMLEASFEHPSVDGFILWGVWDKVHWRGNAPLYDADWNIKAAAAPWFDLVRDQWMPNLADQSVNADGEWVAPIGLYNGAYQITAEANGVSSVAEIDITENGNYVLTVNTVASSTIPVVDEVVLSETAAFIVGETIGITVEGANFDPDATVSLSGTGAVINSSSHTNASTIELFVTLSESASESSQTLTVTNPNNATAQKVFSIPQLSSNEPPTLHPIGDMYVNENSPQQTIALTGITSGDPATQLLRVTAESSNTGLIPHPVVTYVSPDGIGSLSFTASTNTYGTSAITVTVEDAGMDAEFGTTHDNAASTQSFDITVLELLPNQGAIALSKDGSGQLYADAQPVMHQQQQMTVNFYGWQVLGAEDDGERHSLLATRHGVTNRIITDDTWRVTSLFHSLANESTIPLQRENRGAAFHSNVTTGPGAYIFAGTSNPTITVYRGTTYTFNLNTPGHPFYLQTVGGGFNADLMYAIGVIGNGSDSGMLTWHIAEDAPNEIFYQCQFHVGMGGRIIIAHLPSNIG